MDPRTVAQLRDVYSLSIFHAFLIGVIHTKLYLRTIIRSNPGYIVCVTNSRMSHSSSINFLRNFFIVVILWSPFCISLVRLRGKQKKKSLPMFGAGNRSSMLRLFFLLLQMLPVSTSLRTFGNSATLNRSPLIFSPWKVGLGTEKKKGIPPTPYSSFYDLVAWEGQENGGKHIFSKPWMSRILVQLVGSSLNCGKLLELRLFSWFESSIFRRIFFDSYERFYKNVDILAHGYTIVTSIRLIGVIEWKPSDFMSHSFLMGWRS